MNSHLKNRNFKLPIEWTGDLNDDCLARWSGLLLRAECMEKDRWWWCVYDMLDEEKQIDSSNEYNDNCKNGINARKKAEEVAKLYVKDIIISNYKNTSLDAEALITDLKSIKVSPIETIMTLVKYFGFNYVDAKNSVFNASVWKGLREQSEMLTQAFLETGSEDADEVEIIDGKIQSITYNLIKKNDKT